jgi:hypothetical protein
MLQATHLGFIAGRVTRDGRQPLADLQVELVGTTYKDGIELHEPAAQVRTNREGTYEFRHLPPGHYCVRATPGASRGKRPFAPVYYPGVLDARAAAALTLGAGMEMTALDFVVAESTMFSIDVKVAPNNVGDSAIPAFFAVPHTAMTSEPVPLSVVAKSGDSYRVGYLASGAYDLLVVATQNPNQISVARKSLKITDEDADAGAMFLHPAGSVRGYIRFVDSTTPSDVRSITIVARSLGERLPSLTSPSLVEERNGLALFTIKNFPPGYFQLEVKGLPPQAYVAAVHYDGEEVGDRGFLIDGGQDVPMIVEVRSDAALIRGDVIDQNGRLLSSGSVVLIPTAQHYSSIDAFTTGSIGATGLFSISAVAPGRYTVVVLDEPTAYRNPGFLQEIQSRSTSINVDEGATMTLHIRHIPQSRK